MGIFSRMMTVIRANINALIGKAEDPAKVLEQSLIDMRGSLAKIPVILVSADGRSALGRLRLFQPRTSKEESKTGSFLGAGFWGGIYHNRYVEHFYSRILNKPLAAPETADS